MNQGTRRKIRQSQKNDIRYYEGTRADVAKFTAMMQTTGSRNEFGVHEPGYYQLAYDLFVPHDAALILAEHEGDPLAGIMVFAAGKTAWYLYGASSNEKRNLMASLRRPVGGDPVGESARLHRLRSVGHPRRGRRHARSAVRDARSMAYGASTASSAAGAARSSARLARGIRSTTR